MPRALDADFVARYARGPSATTVQTAQSAHTAIRALLGDGDYVTLLQGSYRNTTALWDINDVDVVAVAKRVRSAQYSGRQGTGTVTWDELFTRIESKLQASRHYRGKWERKDKCIQINTEMTVDIVPAIYVQSAEADPVALYSFRERSERQNWPREHHTNGAAKSASTKGAYKPVVRMFKCWAKRWFKKEDKIAPSYYLECLVHSMPDHLFSGDLAADFVGIADHITKINHGSVRLARIAGPGDLFSGGEWSAERFRQFQHRLRQVSPVLHRALTATSRAQAREAWVAAFHGYTA